MNYVRPLPELPNDPTAPPPSSLEDKSLVQKGSPTRLSRVLAGTAVYSLLNWIYDYPLYALVILYAGIFWGGLFMVILSIPIELLILKFYNWSCEDWLAIEYLKSIKDYQGSSLYKKALKFVLLKTPIPLQVAVLSTKFNAFMVTILLRENAYQYNKFSKKEWAIFWTSFLGGQVYWTLVIGTGIEVGELLSNSLQ
jgi:roadblock/LC7 domain-containing protein